ncbi:hypothetical protein H257_07875 [Aphanomyces astaci]|uniref:Uncharacterized protein n=1 Tax=Aphanomyces astaci TaxID=112090 RepID=W4GH44_APHAT|nr:hypothetical protein H257_07875 [Aphanomyces astaci]ETV78283.1 hypothetical protein H257_07875 [Aphanomyces astaci]|eukprot:XP_009831864.1 hypothetical protein H257_07875 [Aphanomyces astaci]
MATYTLDDVVVAVVKSFEELECTVLDKTFMTLQKSWSAFSRWAVTTISSCRIKRSMGSSRRVSYQRDWSVMKMFVQRLMPWRKEVSLNVVLTF